ncbi:MAG TPA: MarR family transcriptional regulator [Ktedonobacterales bacterium]|nr:MarR family transcriptional regulator [Ktedonobacterales bacterium]
MADLPPRLAPFRELLAAQKVIFRELFRMTMPHWMHIDLSMGQLRTLVALATLQAVNISTLAETLEVSKPTASTLVDQLVQRGLVERTEDAEDRRRTLVALSQAGSNMMAQLRQEGPPERMAQWLEAMNPDDLAALTRGTQALAAIVERESSQAPLPAS